MKRLSNTTDFKDIDKTQNYIFQYESKLSEFTLSTLNDLFRANKNNVLRFFGNEEDWTDLDFLKSLDEVQNIVLDNTSIHKPIQSIDNLSYLKKLNSFKLNNVFKKSISLNVLLEHKEFIKELSVGDISKKSYDIIYQLENLQSLGVVSLDFEKSTNLKKLGFLGIGGGQILNENKINSLNSLKSLFINRISNLENLDFLSNSESLKKISLNNLTKTKIEELPKNNDIVQILHINSFKSLKSFENLKFYSSLEQLVIKGNIFEPKDFVFLNELASLKEVYVNFKTNKREIEFIGSLKSNINFLDYIPKFDVR